MGRTCCVPGCKTNYDNTPYVTIFQFPNDKTLREKWIRNIRRDNLEAILNKNSVVCVKHFDSKFVVHEDLFPVVNGDPIRVSRKRPKLTKDAYPTIFENHPFYQTLEVPKSRKKPEERVQLQLQRDEEQFLQWSEQDTIVNFECFSSEVMKKDVKPFYAIARNDHILFLKVDDDAIPSITVSFKITHSLEVNVYHKNICLPTENFKWILETEGQRDLKCDKWSKFESLISHLNSYDDDDKVEFDDRVLMLTKALKETLAVFSDYNQERRNKIKFALEQLELSITTKVKYSAELLIWAASFSYSFPGAYQLLRDSKVMTLPHNVYLRQILSRISPSSPGPGPSQMAFLKEKAKLLQDHDKVVTLMLDEVYVNSKLSYKAGKILGIIDNRPELNPADTMQVFMSSSLHSDHKDVIGLFPVKKMNADNLLKLTLEVLKFMKELEFEVVCLVSGNHSTNRKMFELLCGGTLKPSISNPCDPSKLLFLLFDNVHLLKCLRNNWLKRKSAIFRIPDVEETFQVINDMQRSDGTVTCKDWSAASGVNQLNMDRKFALQEDIITVTDSGLYFMYAQALSYAANPLLGHS